MENTNEMIIQEYSGMLAQANHNTILGIARIKELEEENKGLKELVNQLKEEKYQIMDETKGNEKVIDSNESVMEVEELED